MKISELRKKDHAELRKIVQELRKKLSDQRFTSSTNKTKSKDVRAERKDIARILTILQETITEKQ